MTENHTTGATARERFSWILYDFANSPFTTVIVTAVYVLYFSGKVVGSDDPGYSDKLWGIANSAAAAIVFVLGPILGAAADRGGKRRFFMIFFSLLCVVTTALLATTGAGTVTRAMILVILSVVGFEGGIVFYNSFLPQLADESRIGRLSGQGWGFGYVGGFLCMLAVLPMGDNYAQFIPLVVAAWMLVFAMPAFLFLKDRTPVERLSGSVLTAGLGQFWSTLRSIARHQRLFKFLLAYFFYNNAVMTIIVFAAAFSKVTLSFTLTESILLIGAMNVVAAPGAFVFGWVSDRVGAKRTIIITLFMWLVVVVGAEVAAWPGLFSVPEAKMVFWGVAGLASLCIGATQATSRGFVGQLAPKGRAGEFYGFMAFSGKGSAILGPIVFGQVSDIFNSQLAAVGTIGLFFLVGLILMFRVPSARTQA